MDNHLFPAQIHDPVEMSDPASFRQCSIVSQQTDVCMAAIEKKNQKAGSKRTKTRTHILDIHLC